MKRAKQLLSRLSARSIARPLSWAYEKQSQRLLASKVAVDSSTVGVYWCDINNFGDQLNRDLARRYGKFAVYAPARVASAVGAGSILGNLHDFTGFKGAILGSGLISRVALRLPQANFVAVRGALTRHNLGLDDSVPMGDPGILASAVYGYPDGGRRQTLGIVVHYADVCSPVVGELLGRLGSDVLVISAKQDPRVVAWQISRCDAIASSSLHGLIFAESYGIPTCWLRFSDGLVGGGFKFHDYYSAFGVERDYHQVSGNESVGSLLALLQDPPAGLSAAVSRVDTALAEWFDA